MLTRLQQRVRAIVAELPEADTVALAGAYATRSVCSITTLDKRSPSPMSNSRSKVDSRFAAIDHLIDEVHVKPQKWDELQQRRAPDEEPF